MRRVSGGPGDVVGARAAGEQAVVTDAVEAVRQDVDQAEGGGSGGYAGPPVETLPKVDEKAYTAALDRIPTPDQKFDPWGIARPSEPVKTTKKSN